MKLRHADAVKLAYALPPDKKVVGIREDPQKYECPYCETEYRGYFFLLYDPKTGEIEEEWRNEGGYVWNCPYCGSM